MGPGSAQSEEATLPGTQEAMWGVEQTGVTVPAGAATQLLASGRRGAPGGGLAWPASTGHGVEPGSLTT